MPAAATLTAAVLFLVSDPAMTRVADTDGLVEAFNNGQPGDTIEIAPGTYELSAQLEPKAGMTLKGAGMDRTVINIRDADEYANPQTGGEQGLLEPLKFNCGHGGEHSVSG